MNTHTIEVEVDASGQVHAVDPQVPIPAGPALLTPLGLPRAAVQHGAVAGHGADDWRALVGALRGSPSWRDEPQAIQDRLRDEWR
jgi:hypothetical protein